MEAGLSELATSEREFHRSTILRLNKVIDGIEQIKGLPPWTWESNPDTASNLEINSETFGGFARLLNSWERQRRSERTRAIIESLQFLQIAERESTILEAHQETFKWVFSRERSNIADWLVSGTGIYWISGKAGSGKSTLHKFLGGHQESYKLLRQWSGDKALVTASHFFWLQGTSLQKSQQGLFQTLVCQIMTRYPESVPVMAPKRWSSWTDLQASWTTSELSQCLHNLVSAASSRICLFIDGLDEYHGDHQELVHVLQSLTCSNDIKICASSRPRIEFISAFNPSHWKLQLQDLTHDDILAYVTDRLKSNPDIESYGSEVDSLAQHIGSRAQGVFLWVYLVVRSLVRGMRYKDTMADLQKRLNELPTDLEQYFRLMLDSIESIYRKRAARALLVLCRSHGSTPILTFYFMDLEAEDPQYALRTLPPPNEGLCELEFYKDQAERKAHQLIAQCGDLVHVSGTTTSSYSTSETPWSITTAFLHRSVADFLKTSEVHEILALRSGNDFDPRVSICRSYLAQLKAMNQMRANFLRHPELRGLKQNVLIPGIFLNAKEIKIIHGRSENMKPILDSLEYLLRLESWHLPVLYCRDYLNFVVRIGMPAYAMEYTTQCKDRGRDALVGSLMRPIIIEPGFGFALGNRDQVDLQTTRSLLKCDALFPNGVRDAVQYAWRKRLGEEVGTRTSTVTFEVLHLLLSNGADPTVSDWNRLKDLLRSDQLDDLRCQWENNATTPKEDDNNQVAKVDVGASTENVIERLESPRESPSPAIPPSKSPPSAIPPSTLSLLFCCGRKGK